MSEIQAVLFSRNEFTPKSAKEWLHDYGMHLMRGKQLHVTHNFIRARIRDPLQYKRLRIKHTHDPGVEFVIGFK